MLAGHHATLTPNEFQLLVLSYTRISTSIDGMGFRLILKSPINKTMFMSTIPLKTVDIIH